MRMMTMVAAALAFAAAPAAALAQGTPAVWAREGDRIVLSASKVSVPGKVGTLSFTTGKEFSRPGEGLDSALTYESEDGEVFATVYAYYPSLSDAAISAMLTEKAMRQGEKTAATLQPLGMRQQSAGGVSAGAIRADYSHYMGEMASDAAFVKAGRWIVKLRVSGPDARKAEVDGAMDAILAGLRFPADAKPQPTGLLNVRPCASETMGTAAPTTPTRAQTEADAALAQADAAATRLAAGWCSTELAVNEAKVTLLHNLAPAQGKPTTIALAPIADNGNAWEIVRTADGRYVVLIHLIGITGVTGSYASAPSDAQIAGLLKEGAKEGTVRAAIGLKPGAAPTVEYSDAR